MSFFESVNEELGIFIEEVQKLKEKKKAIYDAKGDPSDKSSQEYFDKYSAGKLLNNILQVEIANDTDEEYLKRKTIEWLNSYKDIYKRINDGIPSTAEFNWIINDLPNPRTFNKNKYEVAAAAAGGGKSKKSRKSRRKQTKKTRTHRKSGKSSKSKSRKTRK